MLRRAMPVMLLVLALSVLGCVERKLTVISTPPGARVYLNGEEKGLTPVTFRFDWYGKQEFLLRKDGYRVLREERDVHEPIYEKPVIDVFADLTPIPFTDHKTISFTLEPITEVKVDDLLDRANELKYRTERKPIPARPKALTSPKPETPPPPAEPVPAPSDTPAPETKPPDAPPTETKPAEPPATETKPVTPSEPTPAP